MGTFSRGFFHMKNFSSSHPFLSIGMVLAALLVGSLMGRSRMRRRAFGNTGGFFHLDGKEGLLGGGQNGMGGKKD
jgi:protein disulfide-isomerase